MRELEQIKRCRPTFFWKHFKSKACTNSRDISLDDFLKYFENMSTDMFNSSNEESEAFNEYNDFNQPNDVYPELDREISIDEIMNAVKCLKRSKSCGKDTLLNEYFLESIDILSAHMCDMFNAILNSGAFPDAQTEGILIPIHKKGQ